jgi:SAM-dependent methyltransferase
MHQTIQSNLFIIKIHKGIDMSTVLHVGCGPQNITRLKGFSTHGWAEIRLDIDPSVTPDVVGTLTDMSSVINGSMDAVYSSHNLEHVFPHEVPVVLREFYRVLNNDGFVVLTCPDLQSVCQSIVEDKLFDPLYVSPAGPIAPIDILYGHRAAMEQGNHYMAHKCGFTWTVLSKLFKEAGFLTILGGQSVETYALKVIASKAALSETRSRELISIYLPD